MATYVAVIGVVVKLDEDDRILLLKRNVRRRTSPNKWQTPSGFINEGESAEEAVIREVKEETSLNIELLDILGVYSDPARDPRGHMMSTVFIAKISSHNDKVDAVAQDDAAAIEWISLEVIDTRNVGFDHKRIISDYKTWKTSGGTFWSSKDRDRSKFN